jgi:hypothetical protein
MKYPDISPSRLVAASLMSAVSGAITPETADAKL